MTSRSGKLDLVAMALAALVVASACITPATRDLIFGDESRYARIAAEMAARGEWIVPSLDGRPYTDKPPLHFDAIIALGGALGFHRTWTFVLPSLLAFAALTVLVGIAARRWSGSAAGGLAAFLFATFLFPWGSAQTARMDLEYALLMTLAIVLLREAIVERRRATMIWCGAATGIAILVKGPAVAAILLPIWVAESFRRRRRPRWEDGAALLLAASIPAAWVGVIAAREGSWAAFDLVVTQNMGRAVSSFAHAKPFWFYFARFPLLFFPWFVLLVIALVALRRRRSDASAFCATWLAVIVLFFSAISGKLEIYLLPAAVPAAILIAAWASSLPPREERSVAFANAVLLVILAAALFALPSIAARVERTPEVALLLASPFRGVAIVGGAAAAAAALAHGALVVRRPAVSLLVTGAAVMAGPVAAAVLMIGLANEIYSSRPLMRVLREHRLEAASLVVYEGFHPWARDYEFDDVDRIREADPWTLKKAPVLPEVVVTRASRATELGGRLRTEYERIATIRIRRKEYDVYELRGRAGESGRGVSPRNSDERDATAWRQRGGAGRRDAARHVERP